jgi:transcriptional regulator with GAF, ATPase, and Fis domain
MKGVYRRRFAYGQFELAHKGTLFLDEMGELPSAPAKIACAGNQGFERIERADPGGRTHCGGHESHLQQAVRGASEKTCFFACQWYPSNSPLRERQTIWGCWRHFETVWARVQEGNLVLSESAFVMESYRWPSNVRELQTAWSARSSCVGARVFPEDLNLAFHQARYYEGTRGV